MYVEAEDNHGCPLSAAYALVFEIGPYNILEFTTVASLMASPVLGW